MMTALALTITSCNINYLDYLGHVDSPDGKYHYALFSDFSIGDSGFCVLKLDKKLDPRQLKIDFSFKNGISPEAAEWIHSREVLSNYDEASEYCWEPGVKIVEKRFLVFSRGGYMFGLYDLKLNKAVFNDSSPWNTWAHNNIWAERGTNYKGPKAKNEKSDYGIWIRKNIHDKIEAYVLANK